MNTRFAVAVHIMTFLETQQGQPASSELIASSVNTNPSLIRRLLSQLAKAKLTTAQMGSGGGALLARAGKTITLLDVYRAVNEDGSVFSQHRNPNPACPVGRKIAPVLRMHLQTAERAILADLAKTTIGDIAAEVTASDNRPSSASSPKRRKNTP